jgi:hypothetical protein
MTPEEAIEVILGGYKEECPWCGGTGERNDGTCVVCMSYGYLIRDEWFTARRVLGLNDAILVGRLVSAAHRTYDLGRSS